MNTARREWPLEADTIITDPETGIPGDGQLRPFDVTLVRTFGAIERHVVWATTRHAAELHGAAMAKTGPAVLHVSAAPALRAVDMAQDLEQARMDADRATLVDLLRLGAFGASIVAVIAFAVFGQDIVRAVWEAMQ